MEIVDRIPYNTFLGACQALNLLENDRHWEVSVHDACCTSNPNQICSLFAIILTACSPSSLTELWDKFKSYMAEDILRRARILSANINLSYTADIYKEALIMIEDLCLAMANKVLTQLGMPAPDRSAAVPHDAELLCGQSYDANDLAWYLHLNLPQMTLEQKSIFDQLMQAVDQEIGGTFFLDAPRGTGKTFLIRLILAFIRSQNKLALALASSGIIATLLPGGRTANSTLKLSLNIKLWRSQFVTFHDHLE